METKAIEGKSGAFNDLKDNSSLYSKLNNTMNNKIKNVALGKMPIGVVFGHLVVAPSGSLPLKIESFKKKKKKSKKEKKKDSEKK